jgi:hypothetical protein
MLLLLFAFLQLHGRPSTSSSVYFYLQMAMALFRAWQLWVDINKTNHTLKYSQVSPEQEAVGLYHNQ